MSDTEGLLKKLKSIVGVDTVQLKMGELLPNPNLMYTEADVLKTRSGLVRLFRKGCIDRQITASGFRDKVREYMEGIGASEDQIKDRLNNLKNSTLINPNMTYETFVVLMETIGLPIEAVGIEVQNKSTIHYTKEEYWDDDLPVIDANKRKPKRAKTPTDARYDVYDVLDVEGDLARLFRLVCYTKKLTDLDIRERSTEYFQQEGMTPKQVADKINNMRSTTLRNPNMKYSTFLELMAAIKHPVIRFGIKVRVDGQLSLIWEF